MQFKALALVSVALSAGSASAAVAANAAEAAAAAQASQIADQAAMAVQAGQAGANMTGTSGVAVGPSDIVKAIEKVTDLSDDTNDILKDVKSGNVIAVIPKALGSLKDIIVTVMQDTQTITSAKGASFPTDAQKEICQSFTGFVKVHQNLLETIIGEKGLLSSTPFTAPVAAVLRIIESVVDNLALGIISLVPTCAAQAKKDKKSLDGTLDKAISTYQVKLPGLGGGGLPGVGKLPGANLLGQ